MTPTTFKGTDQTSRGPLTCSTATKPGASPPTSPTAGAAAQAAADKRGVTRSQRHIHDGPRHVRLHPNAGSIAATHYLTSWATTEVRCLVASALNLRLVAQNDIQQ
jgi:hypothetical protein